MDARLYILAGALALVVLAILYLLISLVRAARARRNRATSAPVTPYTPPSPSVEERSGDDPSEDPFTTSLSEPQPLRTGDWRPAEEPSAEELPAWQPPPEVVADPDEWAIPDPSIASIGTPDEAVDDPTPTTSVDEVWAGLVAEIESQAQETPAPSFEPPSVELPVPAAVDPLESAPVEPTLAETSPPGAEPFVGEPELPLLAEEDSEPVIPASEQESEGAGIAEDDFEEQWRRALAAEPVNGLSPVVEPEPEPVPEPVVPPLEPQPEPISPPELKQPAIVDTAALENEWLAALSDSMEAPPAVQPEAPAPPAAEAPKPTPQDPPPPSLPAPAREIPDYEMAAPVEMWFGDLRVGVRPGTRTFDQFQRFASVLFDELSRSRRGA